MSKLKKALAGLMAVCMLMSTLTPAMAYSADVSMAEETNPVVAGDAVLADEEPSTPDDIEEPGGPTPTEAPKDGTEDDASKGDDVLSEPESTPEPSATPEEAEPAEAPTEDSTEFVPFQLEDPEGGDTQEANLGETVTFTAKGTRDDVQVIYQWQVMRKGIDYSALGAIYNYAEEEPTWYNFPLEGITEAEQLENNPGAGPGRHAGWHLQPQPDGRRPPPRRFPPLPRPHRPPPLPKPGMLPTQRSGAC